jgi:hypothetical protein
MATGFRVRNCALSMLDVLGFKHKLDGPDRIAEFERFVAIVEEVRGAFDSNFTPPNPLVGLLRSSDERALLWSDTLIYWKDIGQETTDADALVSAATFAIRVIGRGLENGFLLRGAMSVGELLTYDNPEAIAGPVVNECAQQYEAVDWYGCHLAPSACAVLDSTPADQQGRTGPRFKKYRLPRKGGIPPAEEWAVCWLDYLARILPQYATAVPDGALKSRILDAREAARDEHLAVRQFFIEQMRQYANENPAARGKVEATFAAIAQDAVSN